MAIGENALPDVKTKFRVDYTELTKAEKAIARANGQYMKMGTKSAQAVKNTEGTVNKLTYALNRLGPVGQKAARGIDEVSTASNKLKIAGVVAGVVAAAAIYEAGVQIEKQIDKYVALGEQVRKYREITGQSAEDSSRQVIVFKELGVESDQAALSMFRLGRNAATTEDKLNKVGVQVARNKDGTVDLNGTLLNVIRAYHAAGDAAQRDVILFTAFGRGGSSMIPILEANVDEIARLEARVGKVYTQADLDRVRKYTIAQKQAQESADEWGRSIGEFFLPAQKAVYDSLNENIYVNRKLDEARANGTLSAQAGRGAVIALAEQYRQEYHDAQDAKGAEQELADTTAAVAEAAKEAEKQEEALSNSFHKSIDATFGYRQSLLDLKSAQKDAAKAKGKDAELNLRLEESYVKVADAAVELAVEQAGAKGATLDQDAQTKIWINTLEALISKLDKKSPLRRELQGYIDQLNSIPSAKSTTLSLRTAVVGSTREKRNLGYASGGDPPVNRVVKVGEGGPELAAFTQPVHIYPNGQSPSTIASSPTIVQVVIDSPVMLDNLEVGRFVDKRVVKVMRGTVTPH